MTCWQEMLDIFPAFSTIIPFSVIAIGYPKEDKEPESRYDESKIHLGKY